MRNLRRLAIVLTLPLLLFLTSCIRLTMDLDIESPDRVNVSADFGMQNAAAQEMGSDLPDFCDEADFADTDDASMEPYTEEGPEGYTGCRISGTGSVSEFAGDGTSLTLEDDIWTFAMEGGDAGGSEGLSANMLTDFRVSVTFPGEVLTHNGSSTVDGRTVTWTNPADLFGEGLHATASNTGGGSIPWLWIVLGIVALAAIGALVWFLTRRKQTPPASPPYGPQGQQYPPQGQPYPPQGQQYPPQGPPQGQPYPPQGPPQGPPQPGQQGGSHRFEPGAQPGQQGFQSPQQPPQGFQPPPPSAPQP